MGVLEGKVAIVTGGASGQGEAEAKLFHAEGAAVIITDLNPQGEALAASLGDKAVFLHHNVSEQAGWAAVADLARQRFGKVDILINNAGITGYQSVEDITLEQMRRYLDVHLYGALFGIQAIVPLMPAEGGAIVNVASTAALKGYSNYVGYGVSKWAMRGLTRYAAHDLVCRNIRINTILPGGIDTPMIFKEEAQEGGNPLIDAARAAVPMKRFGTVDEIARTALFLVSGGSTYMTGSDIVVDGGHSA